MVTKKNNTNLKSKKRNKLIISVAIYALLPLLYCLEPIISGQNFYQDFGYDQVVSVNIDPSETVIYVSRLITYKQENDITKVEPGDRIVFDFELDGQKYKGDGNVTSVNYPLGYVNVTSAGAVTNIVHGDQFIGIFKRVSNVFDRFMFFNFTLFGRVLVAINFTAILAFCSWGTIKRYLAR